MHPCTHALAAALEAGHPQCVAVLAAHADLLSVKQRVRATEAGAMLEVIIAKPNADVERDEIAESTPTMLERNLPLTRL